MCKTALITGGSRGIGKAIVERFRAHGFDVIAPTRQELDLACMDSIQRFITNMPRCDILVNNAAINIISETHSIEYNDWNKSILVNMTAPMILAKHAVPNMKKQNWGRILNISSCYSLVSRIGRGTYGTTKAGIGSFTRTLAIEYGKFNILANCLCPGFVETELTRENNSEEQLQSIIKQIPLGRLATPEEIANYTHFLCSENNSYITGQSIIADGGFLCQ
jgi:3-oxoacyl-[acyl-carrier protein] reductase